MGCAASTAIAPSPPERLMIFSEHAAAMPNFEAALQAVGTRTLRFNFETANAADLIASIEGLVAAQGQFERIAFAQFGPEHAPQAATSEDECFWELSKNCVMTDPTQLSQADHPARQLLVALGRATVKAGFVDLLSCGVLATWACPRRAWPTLKGFSSIEAEADCHFNASTHALAGSPLQSEDEWLMESDEALNIKQAYFLPRSQSLSAEDMQLRYAKEHESLIRVAPGIALGGSESSPQIDAYSLHASERSHRAHGLALRSVAALCPRPRARPRRVRVRPPREASRGEPFGHPAVRGDQGHRQGAHQ